MPISLTRRRVVAGVGGTLAAAGAAPVLAAPHVDVDYHTRNLIFGTLDTHLEAIEALRERGGTDLIASLILALRFTRQDDAALRQLMNQIAEDDGPQDWFDWMLWQEARPEVIPHPSHTGLKRDIYLRIDPNFDVFLNEDALRRDRMKIRLEEITWGGVRKDGIPALTNPNLISAEEADYLVGSDFVFGVSINGDTRAYPLRIMGWHEMFNDVIGGVPLALAYCTLCGAGILFETQLEGRDKPMIFGSSGFLYRSNKLMYDQDTHSLWNQFTGRPVSGALVDSGIELRQRPVVIEPWVRWVARNPDTKVLSLDTGYRRDYGSGVVYDKYFRSPNLMFPAQVDQTRLAQKDYVFGIRTFGGAKAWPVTAFEGGRVINDNVAGLNVVLVGDRLGRTVRAYDRGDRVFDATDNPGKVSSAGTGWTVTEEALLGPDGARAPRVAGHIAYWFAWDGYLGSRSEFYTE